MQVRSLPGGWESAGRTPVGNTRERRIRLQQVGGDPAPGLGSRPHMQTGRAGTRERVRGSSARTREGERKHPPTPVPDRRSESAHHEGARTRRPSRVAPRGEARGNRRGQRLPPPPSPPRPPGAVPSVPSVPRSPGRRPRSAGGSQQLPKRPRRQAVVRVLSSRSESPSLKQTETQSGENHQLTDRGTSSLCSSPETGPEVIASHHLPGN